MSEQSRKLSAGGCRKRLAPSVKYEVFTLVLTNQATQAEIAAMRPLQEEYPVRRSLQLGCTRGVPETPEHKKTPD